VVLDGTAMSEVADAELAALRNRSVGFVFQFHHLLKEFTALENVMMPLRIGGKSSGEARARAQELLERVGKTVAFLETIKPAQVDGSEDRTVTWKIRDKDFSMQGL